MNRVTVTCEIFKQSNLYVIYLETLFRVLAAKKRENGTKKLEKCSKLVLI